MDITIFGAAGDVGKRIVNEALIRGHKVTGVVRSEAQYAKLPDNVRSRVADAAVPAQVARMAEGQDLVISAVRPPEGRRCLSSLLEPVIRRLLIADPVEPAGLPGRGSARLSGAVSSCGWHCSTARDVAVSPR